MEKRMFVTYGRNLRKNWFFLASALAFLCLHITLTLGYMISIPIALVCAFAVSVTNDSLWLNIRQEENTLIILSVVTTAGICWGSGIEFYDAWKRTSIAMQIEEMVRFPVEVSGCLAILCAVCAGWFILYYVMHFWRGIAKIAAVVFRGIGRGELVLYCGFAVISILFYSCVFLKTDAFYGTSFLNDIIYTSDSPSLVRDNVYFSLAHQENDFRQPLFAVFAAPLLAIPYLVGCLLRANPTIQAIALNCGQMVMFTMANIALARLLRLDAIKRVFFIILTSCTYASLLFTLMMEQYIVAYFWLILLVFYICSEKPIERMLFWGTGGTLITGAVLLPALAKKHPIKQFREWFVDTLKYGVEFLVLMFTFGRFQVIWDLGASISYLSRFVGEKVSLTNKVFQYTEFIRNVFAAPQAGLNTTAVDHISWQLYPATSLSWAGIGILALCVISAVWNWKNKSSRLAAFWVAFSVVMLLILGWGTAENGLILYSLYFGWAFLVLLFQLVEKLESTLRIKYLTVVCSIAASAGLLVMNLPAILEMICFAIDYYPV